MEIARSDAWQPQNRAQASERTFIELQRTAVNRGEFDDDRQAKAGARARLVEPVTGGAPFDPTLWQPASPIDPSAMMRRLARIDPILPVV